MNPGEVFSRVQDHVVAAASIRRAAGARAFVDKVRGSTTVSCRPHAAVRPVRAHDDRGRPCVVHGARPAHGCSGPRRSAARSTPCAARSARSRSTSSTPGACRRRCCGHPTWSELFAPVGGRGSVAAVVLEPVEGVLDLGLGLGAAHPPAPRPTCRARGPGTPRRSAGSPDGRTSPRGRCRAGAPGAGRSPGRRGPSSPPASSVMRNMPIARQRIRQPGKVGSCSSTRASSGSPSRPRGVLDAAVVGRVHRRREQSVRSRRIRPDSWSTSYLLR